MKNWMFLFLFLPLWGSAQLYFPPTSGNQWDTVHANSLGWCENYLDTLHNFLDNANTKGFLILKDGKIVNEMYFDNFTEDSLWYWASASKSLFAFLVGQAQADGDLSLSDTVSHYLGNWTNCTPAEEEKVTIWNQLTMTSGFDGSDPWTFCLEDTCLNCIANPGTAWYYHNSPYTLSHDVLKSATAKNINVYTWSKVATPIGMGGLWIKTGDLELYFSKLRGMARFGLLMLAKGQWNQITLMADSNYFNDMISTSQSMNQSYGYLWWLNGKSSHMLPSSTLVFPGSIVPDAPADMYAAMGKNEQRIYVVPSENLVVVRMGQAAGATQLALSSFDNELWILLNKLRCSDISVKEQKLQSWELNPNPVKDYIYFPTKGLPFTLCDLNGRVLKAGMSQERLLVNRLKSGFYILKLEGYWPVKLIK